VSECFFWYRPTWVVPDKVQLNGCVCVCVLMTKLDVGECLQQAMTDRGMHTCTHNTHTHTHTQPFNCTLGLPRWAGTRRNIHSLTPILIIRHSLSTSSIFTIHGILLVQFVLSTGPDYFVMNCMLISQLSVM